MRGAASSMVVRRPATPRDALRRFGDAPDALPLAGGTDLMVMWNLGSLNGRTILDLSRLDRWKTIDSRRDSPRTAVRIGALATHAAIQRHAAIRREFPLLVQSCATVGGVQIQNRGTIGGNIANASPAGDTFPALAVYEAEVVVSSAAGSRIASFDSMFVGPKKTTLTSGELVEAVVLTRSARPPDVQIFRKIGTRAAQAISKVVVAGALWLDGDGRVEDVRFAVGSVAPTVRRLRIAEAFLRGQSLTPDVIAHAATLVSGDISPIDDIRSTAEYRLQTTSGLFRDFLRLPRG
jgi:CO/xanthine dehydrogenase FAD-binding subunit